MQYTFCKWLEARDIKDVEFQTLGTHWPKDDIHRDPDVHGMALEVQVKKVGQGKYEAHVIGGWQKQEPPPIGRGNHYEGALSSLDWELRGHNVYAIRVIKPEYQRDKINLVVTIEKRSAEGEAPVYVAMVVKGWRPEYFEGPYAGSSPNAIGHSHQDALNNLRYKLREHGLTGNIKVTNPKEDFAKSEEEYADFMVKIAPHKFMKDDQGKLIRNPDAIW